MPDPASKRILFVTTVAVTLQGFLRPIAEDLGRSGWTVDGAAAGTGSYPELADAFGRLYDLDWKRRPLSPRNLLGYLELRRLLRGYDLVHVHTPVASFLTRVARATSPRFRGKLIYTAHGFHFHPLGRPLPNRVYLAAEKCAGRWTDRLVVINDEDERAALRWGIVPAERLVRMRGIGIDTGFFDPGKVSAGDIDALRRTLDLDPGIPVITMVANFFRFKHHDNLIAAVKNVSRTRDVRVVFAGEGPARDEVQRLVRDSGLGSRFRFAGFIRDMRTLYRLSSMVVTASTREGLPRSVMEALSMARPVIGTEIRGTRELLADDCGILIPPRSTEALIRAILKVLEEPDWAAGVGARGREKMRGEYEIAAILRAHRALYEGVLGF